MVYAYPPLGRSTTKAQGQHALQPNPLADICQCLALRHSRCSAVFLPDQLAPVFAWKVTPFMTMTIGGWCLGNAWLAYISARRSGSGELIYPSLTYLWLFGVGELLVVLIFRDKLKLRTSGGLALSHSPGVERGGSAFVGISDWLRIRPNRQFSGQTLTLGQRWPILAFVMLVGFLGMYGLSAPIGAPGTNGGIFPEVMSLFTLRSFGTFYTCLALGVLPLLWEKNPNTILHHAWAAYGLVAFITVAAFVYIRLFDFVARPGGLLYFGAYLVVGHSPVFHLPQIRHGSGNVLQAMGRQSICGG